MTTTNVSVIVSMYNSELYLERCLESLAGQSYPDFEVICVDDASTDSSAEIASRLVQRDARFRLVRHPANRGGGAAFNSGLEAARGRYISVVDSDDSAAPDMLRSLVGTSLAGKADLVMGGYRETDEAGTPNGFVFRPSSDLPNPQDPRPGPLWARVQLWGRLWLRDLFIKHDIRCPDGSPQYDMATSPRLMQIAQCVSHTDEIIYNYTVRKESLSRSGFGRRITSFEADFLLVKRHMEAAGIFYESQSAYQGWVCVNLTYSLTREDMETASEDEFREGLEALRSVKKSAIPGSPQHWATDRTEATIEIGDFVNHVGKARFAGAVLPSARGIAIQGRRVGLAERNGTGTLTFGPYLTLRKGSYRLTIDYIAKERGHRWDLSVSAGGQIVAEGKLAPGARTMTFNIDLREHHRDVEIRTFLGRKGLLAVEMVEVQATRI